jgi:hypothetical protein
MSLRAFASVFLLAWASAGCGVLPDVRLGKDEGVPPIEGSTTISVPQNYSCGDPITDPKAKYQVTSTGTADACTFTFKQDVTALKASDYEDHPELIGAQVINGIDIDVNEFAITDPATGMQPAGLQSVDGKAFGETILTEADLGKKTPFTKTIKGAAVDALKSKVQDKKDIVIPVTVVVVVALTPTPPAELKLDFDAQPNLDIGF